MTSEDQAAGHLTPAMASFRLLVAAFVREYIERWLESPSQSEIANGLGASRDKVRDALDSLVADGYLLRVPGARGLRLPSVREQAVRQLRELGFLVDEDIGRIRPPESPLPPRPLFDYPEHGSEPPLPRGQAEDGDGQQAA